MIRLWLAACSVALTRTYSNGWITLLIIINVRVMISCLIILCSFSFRMSLVILVQFFTQMKFRISLSSKENTFRILVEELLTLHLHLGRIIIFRILDLLFETCNVTIQVFFYVIGLSIMVYSTPRF